VSYSIRDFLEIRTAGAAGFSPDGTKVLVTSNLTGTSQLYRVPSAGGDLVQLTDFAEPVSGAYLPTTDEILFAMDEGGNERTQLYLMDDAGGEACKLVYDPDYIHRPGGVTRDGATLAYASNRRNGVDFDIYIRDLRSDDDRCVFAPGGWCQPADFSPDGRYLAAYRLTERNADNDIHLVDIVTGESFVVAPHDEDAAVLAPAWLPDSSGFFFATDVGREHSAIARFEMATRAWRPVIEREWDLDCAIDRPGTALLVATNDEGYTRDELVDPRSLRKLADVSLPDRAPAPREFSPDGRFIAYSLISPVDPGDAWLYDVESRARTRLTASPHPVPAHEFVEPTLHRFASFDGESMPIFVFRPRRGGPHPVIVTIHGGPESQYMPAFNPVTQYLVHRGFAVVAPNVRGSTGYGKRFHHLDDVRKRLDSVRDLEALYGWLRAAPDLDHTRAALWGGSYGGYMVLAGLAFQPELWAAGVDIVGISSLVTFLENTAAWRRAFREREYGSLQNDRDFLVEASPITQVAQMRAPLFIIHGANDPRVPLGEAEQIHGVLRAKGIPTELLVYHDEGHGLAKLRNRLDAYPKAVDFLDRILAR
jgi:dipeptidyl aminopeptidase/acylaminoacyl peptidase